MTSVLAEARRATADVAPLIAFRVAGARGRNRRRVQVGLGALVGLLVACSVVPAVAPGAATSERTGELVLLLPTAFLAFLGATTFATVAAAGGRELLPRDVGVSYPVSPTTDHLGALLMAPLNIAWLLQAFSMLGLVAYVNGPRGLGFVQITVVAWLISSTVFAQLVAWGVEWIRRRPFGIAVIRLLGLALVLLAVGLTATNQVTNALDHSPTVDIAVTALRGSEGFNLPWLTGTVLILLLGTASVVMGGVASHAVARRPARDEARVEGRYVSERPMPRSEFGAMVRLDRSAVWRSVPLRRGFMVLAALPGFVAAAGSFDWDMLPIMPGLVAAGGALLFGVNAWCLDGTGALWRDSLPIRPDLVFAARAFVLGEMLASAIAVTLVLAAFRAPGTPTEAEVVSLVLTAVVVTLQVLARSLHWSVHRPYATDLRSARATPAPPVTMMTYSAYLALTSTLTGMVFGITAQASSAMPALLVAMPLVILAVRRLVITARVWGVPEARAHVVTTVAVR
ncbi:MAG: hypothetical protein ACRDO2_13995 [Nocardioidaceae bacterium]